MNWELLLILLVGGILYKLKSVHIEFGANKDNEAGKPKQIKNVPRKQLKK